MKDLLLSIDIGTTNCKIIVYNQEGEKVCKFEQEVPLIINRLGLGWMEKDVVLIWETICYLCSIISAEIDIERIAAIGVSGLRQSMVFVDEHGDPLRPAILWGTKATIKQIDYIKEHVGEQRMFEITGLPVDPVWAASSILYVVQEEPEVEQKTYKYLEVVDYIIYKLSGVFTSDHSQSGCIALYDKLQKQWSKEITDKLEIPKYKLPQLQEPGTIVGYVSQEAHDKTNLPSGVPVVTCGGDCQTSALGCGVLEQGLANVSIGTAGVATVYTKNPILDDEKRVVCQLHSKPGAYVLDINTLTAGNAYKWYTKQILNLSRLYENPYDELRKAIEGSPIGGNNLIFLPHMVGAACPQWDPKSKGAFVGLTLDTSIGDLGRAIIEGSSMEISQGFRIVKDLGIDIKEIRLSGGACVKGSPWNQIQADVYGIPVAVTSDMDTTSIGCAILSAKACGMYKSLEDASDCMVRIIERIEPIDTNHNRYIKLSDIQNDVYEGLKSKKIFDRLFDEI